MKWAKTFELIALVVITHMTYVRSYFVSVQYVIGKLNKTCAEIAVFNLASSK